MYFNFKLDKLSRNFLIGAQVLLQRLGGRFGRYLLGRIGRHDGHRIV
jgi:hypothetical protein